jgi:hypothetical protein
MLLQRHHDARLHAVISLMLRALYSASSRQGRCTAVVAVALVKLIISGRNLHWQHVGMQISLLCGCMQCLADAPLAAQGCVVQLYRCQLAYALRRPACSICAECCAAIINTGDHQHIGSSAFTLSSYNDRTAVAMSSVTKWSLQV